MVTHRAGMWSIVGGALLLAGQLQAQLVPQTEEQKLKGADAPGGGLFGFSLEAQGDELFVGAVGDDVSIGDQGAVHVLHWNATAWVETQQLFASDAGPVDFLGMDLDVDGDLLLVGAPNHDHLVNNQGMAYAFRRQGGSWIEDQHLFPTSVDTVVSYAWKVALSGDRAFVHGNFDDPQGQAEQSAIFVFRRTPSGWIEESPIILEGLTKPTIAYEDLAAAGDLVAFGGSVRHPEDFTFEPGTVRIFEFANGAWSLQATLAPSDGHPKDYFGSALDLEGERLAVGAFNHDVTPAGDEGAIYVYRREGALWVQEPIVGESLPPVSGLGNSVVLEGSLLAAGAPSAGAADGGSLFVYRWTGTEWHVASRHEASDSTIQDGLGATATLSGPMAIAGAPGDWTGSQLFNPHGSAYTFDTLPIGWSFRGGSVAGAQGHPMLTAVGVLGGGDQVTLSLELAAPLAPVVIVIGFSALQVPFKGGVLVPHPDVLVAGLVTDAQGVLTLTATWPGLPAGTKLYFQHWIVDAAAPAGLAASNGVQARVP